jgi:hypothetical protein
MVPKSQSLPRALKHAAYSATTLLPGENFAEFEGLHRRLVKEFEPDGPLEEDIVFSIARYSWRKQNLKTFALSDLACARRNQLVKDSLEEAPPAMRVSEQYEIRQDLLKQLTEIGEEQAKKELGWWHQFVELSEMISFERLIEQLGVEERLDAAIDRALKRLLLVRGVKSIAPRSEKARTASRSAPKLDSPARLRQVRPGECQQVPAA